MSQETNGGLWDISEIKLKIFFLPPPLVQSQYLAGRHSTGLNERILAGLLVLTTQAAL